MTIVMFQTSLLKTMIDQIILQMVTSVGELLLYVKAKDILTWAITYWKMLISMKHLLDR